MGCPLGFLQLLGILGWGAPKIIPKVCWGPVASPGGFWWVSEGSGVGTMQPPQPCSPWRGWGTARAEGQQQRQ